LSAAYYLLPGPYEWENGRRQELLTICLLPPLGVAAFFLATGRLTYWIGSSLSSTVVAWAILLLLSLPTWRSLTRLLPAAGPSLLLINGKLDPFLLQANIPIWFAWVILGLVSLMVSARVYVFGVLPTLGICWLITRFG
jgi:hypothetical protein